MNKQEELMLLEQIDALIRSADPGDYIPMTFAGIVEVCRRNITDDFGNCPVEDLENMREKFDQETRAHNIMKKMFDDSQKALAESIDECAEMKTLADSWEQNAHDAGEMYCALESECARKDDEIRKLKAEIFRMRLERMTESDMADMYDKMKGENNNE